MAHVAEVVGFHDDARRRDLDQAHAERLGAGTLQHPRVGEEGEPALLERRRASGAPAALLAIAPTGRRAEGLGAALQSLVPDAQVLHFPAWETLPHERLSPSTETVGRRLSVLREAAQWSDAGDAPLIVTASVRGALQPVAAGLTEAGALELAVSGRGYDLESVARRLVGLHIEVVEKHGVHLPEMDLGGGYGIAYTSEHDPMTPAHLGADMAAVCERELKALDDLAPGAPRPRISIEPGRAIAGPSTLTLYEVGTVKQVQVTNDAVRSYVSVDGGMSDNVRTALYGADYSCTLASRGSEAAPAVTRVVGRHCESGDIVVMDEYLPADLAPGDLLAVPGTGAYCRSLSSQYNHTPRPPVIAVRDGRARVIVRRETIDDILALDVDDHAGDDHAVVGASPTEQEDR